MKTKASEVISIDCSTNSLAFARYTDGVLKEYGEVPLTGNDIFQKSLQSKLAVRNLLKDGTPDFVAFEAAIFVNNLQVAIKLAYVYGAAIAEFVEAGCEVVTPAPITWQTAIGNPNLTKQEKADIKQAFPEKSDSWYKNYGRKFRKDRTRQIAESLAGTSIESDNESDAIGIGLYTVQTLTKV